MRNREFGERGEERWDSGVGEFEFNGDGGGGNARHGVRSHLQRFNFGACSSYYSTLLSTILFLDDSRSNPHKYIGYPVFFIDKNVLIISYLKNSYYIC